MVGSSQKSESVDEQFSSTTITTKESVDPHSTKWSDVNLLKFGALITVSSTVENAFFYPYVIILIIYLIFL